MVVRQTWDTKVPCFIIPVPKLLSRASHNESCQNVNMNKRKADIAPTTLRRPSHLSQLSLAIPRKLLPSERLSGLREDKLFVGAPVQSFLLLLRRKRNDFFRGAKRVENCYGYGLFLNQNIVQVIWWIIQDIVISAGATRTRWVFKSVWGVGVVLAFVAVSDALN